METVGARETRLGIERVKDGDSFRMPRSRMFEIARSTISVSCLSEITDAIVATSKSFIRLVGVGD